ncbi:MAG: hypothetical protein LBS25_03495 [Candidatus Symbiothrix sp.]|jgi:uncharacterized membrane protein YfcA|nr:hypothetical protein [Candidatus Symbiothrix sp.]
MNWPVKTYLFYFFGILLMVSALLYLTEWQITPYLYAAASLGLAVLFLITPYKGDNFRLKRLNIQQAIAAIMLPVSAWLMYNRQNEWIVCLLVSSLLLTYIVFVCDYENKKNQKSDGTDNKPAK